MYIIKTDEIISEKESNLPISSMEPTLLTPKVLTDEWNIFFFVVLFNVCKFIRLFSRLLDTKSCTKLSASIQTSNSFHWKFTSNSLWIHFVFTLNSALRSHFIGQKATELKKKNSLIFSLKLFLLFFFICLLKTLNQGHRKHILRYKGNMYSPVTNSREKITPGSLFFLVNKYPFVI